MKGRDTKKQNYILQHSLHTILFMKVRSYFIMVPHGAVSNQHIEHANVEYFVRQWFCIFVIIISF